jgi:hypothetical protein
MHAAELTGVLLLVVGAAGCGGVPATHVTLDPAKRFQTIDGWATVTRYWEEDKANDRFDTSFEPYVEAVAKFLVDDVGINAVRLEILSGMENPQDYWKRFYEGRLGYREYAAHRYEKINDDADPGTQNTSGFQFDLFDYRVRTAVLPLKRALEARGERLHLNLCYVDFRSNASAGRTVQGSLSHANDPEEFAEFVLVYFRRLREKYDLMPDSFEIVLEPENTAAWGGQQIGQALVVVADRLREQGFTPDLLAPSNTSMGNAIRYFDEMIRVPGVAERLDTFVYHRYRRQRASDVERIASRARERGLETAMLETIDAGIDTLLEDLTLGQVSAWQLWGPAARLESRDSGAVYALVDTASAPANPRIVRSKRADELSHVFRHVRRGAVRVDSRSSPASQTSAAFINPDGQWVVVVRLVSATEKLTIAGLPAGEYGMRFTGDSGSHVDSGSVTVSSNGTLTTVPPAPGVLTAYGPLGR